MSTWRLMARRNGARRRRWLAPAMLALLLHPVVGLGDQVRTDSETLLGKITAASPAGVTVDTSTGERRVPAPSIRAVTFDDDPPALARARNDFLSGRFAAVAAAASELQGVTSDNPLAADDLEYLPAIAAVRAATSGEQVDVAAAAARLLDVVRGRPRSFRVFESAAALAEVARASEDADGLTRAAELLHEVDDDAVQAWSELQRGEAALLQQDFAAAEGHFARAAKSAQSAGDAKMQGRASLGTVASAASAAAAAQALEEFVAAAPAEETLLHAQAYLLLGRRLEQAGAPLDAALAYLHVDVLYAEQTAEHVAALRRLVPLWIRLDREDRSRKSAEVLRRNYPPFAVSD